MTEKPVGKAKPTPAHTEVRRQDPPKPEREEAADRPKPRTPVDRLPVDGDEDDLFNDMPV